MPNTFQSLPIDILPVATKLKVPVQAVEYASVDDSASKVMTDLTCVCAITISVSEGIHDAEYKMKKQQVKMLFVVDHNGNVIGILTYSDVSGHRITDSEEELNIPISEMCILDIMTGIDSVDVLDYQDIKNAKVGDVIETLKQLNRQHILVLEKQQDMHQIRGIFSSAQISRQLQVDLNIPYSQMSELENTLKMA